MRSILQALIQFILFRFRSRASIELEVIALRHQLKVMHARYPAPIKVSNADRLFFATLYHVWPKSLSWVSLVRPKTVIDWHYRLFCWYWSRKHPKGGFNRTSFEIRQLIRQMALENPIWGIARIHGELLKLGYKISIPTISKYMPRWRPPSPGWRTFLKLHLKETVGIDFFVTVSATFRLLYAFVMIDHGRRKIIHYGVTEHPTSKWVTRQITEAFKHRTRPRYILRDRDAIYREGFRKRLKQMGIRERVIARRAPWQNAYVESLIRSIRRECVNHLIPINEAHLSKVLGLFVEYYNKARTHQGLRFDAPDHRPVQRRSKGKIVSIPLVCGLHHKYERQSHGG